MVLSSNSLDKAADWYVRARFKVSEAERKGLDLDTALSELQEAETHWRAICDTVKREPRRPALAFPWLRRRRI